MTKNYKNRLSLAKVIVKNKMSRFLWFTVYWAKRHTFNNGYSLLLMYAAALNTKC